MFQSRRLLLRVVSYLALTSVCLLVSSRESRSQEMPQPDGDPIEGGYFHAEGPDGEVTVRSSQGNTFQRKTIRLPAGYNSPTLQATFLAQWMYITQRGQKVNFWGARIIKMAPDSPLRALSLRPGDVITRLDGVPIWQDMYREGPGQPFQLPNLEEHFGGTEVRYITQGTNRVRIGQINIDTDVPDDDDSFVPVRP